MAEKDVRNGIEYSIADQVARFANAKATGNARYLDITTVYDGTPLKGLRILITGAEQGLGLELVKEIVANGGHAIQAGRTSSAELDAVAAANPGAVTIITGIDVTKEEAMAKMCAECKEPVDIVINCAGYFYGPAESVGVGREGHLNFPQELLQIDICALGPLRITSALYKAGLLEKDGKPGKVIIITSQAGSCEWRFTQNPTPKPGEEFHGNYGHHMSRGQPPRPFHSPHAQPPPAWIRACLPSPPLYARDAGVSSRFLVAQRHAISWA